MSDRPWTVRRLLEWTAPFFQRKDVDSPRLAAELLLSHVLGVPRIKLYTDYDRVLSDAHLGKYRALVQRAAEQEPIAYLTGTAHFFNLEFHVTRDVLIPRPDTETLVENVLQLFRHSAGFEAPRILDLCTGSGCIAAAIAKHLKSASVTAVDVSEAALAVAEKNLAKLELSQRVVLHLGDLYDALAGEVDVQPFDLVVSNPPYIATAKIETLDRSVREYEPMLALDGGMDGLRVVRRVLDGLRDRLRPGGRALIEIAFDQRDEAIAMSGDFDFLNDVRVLKDHAGNDRVLTVQRA